MFTRFDQGVDNAHDGFLVLLRQIADLLELIERSSVFQNHLYLLERFHAYERDQIEITGKSRKGVADERALQSKVERAALAPSHASADRKAAAKR